MKKKSKPCKYPYLGYVYYRSVLDGRVCYYLYKSKNGKRKLLTRARYRMSVALERRLKKREHVDHIDGNKRNDKISNLQILSPQQNNAKAIKETGRTQKWKKLICPVCELRFKRKAHRVDLKIQRGGRPTCSRECGYKFGALKNLR